MYDFTDGMGERRSIADFTGRGLTDGRLAEIAQDPDLLLVDSLILSANHFGLAGVSALSLSGRVSHLRYLSLSCNPLGDEGVKALSGDCGFLSLSALDLSSCGFRDEGAAALAQSPLSRRLALLDISHNHIQEDGILALAGSLSTARDAQRLWQSSR